MFEDRNLRAVLDALPVDITFIDNHDTVRYFNQPDRGRIFPRSETVIGKKVQDCHPQNSIEKVNAVLKDLRSGRRGSARFWINLKGRTIYIRYFPVRRDGQYMGCLEVSQDITEMRKIKGEKRLYDEPG